MVTRFKNNIFKPKTVFDYLVVAPKSILPLAPTTYHQASEYPEWCTAMENEYDALLKNKT